YFFFSSRRRHTRWPRDWSSDVCSSDLRRCRGGSESPPTCGAPERRAPQRRELMPPHGAVEREAVHQQDRRAVAPNLDAQLGGPEIGRASCRERGEVKGGRRPTQRKNEH